MRTLLLKEAKAALDHKDYALALDLCQQGIEQEQMSTGTLDPSSTSNNLYLFLVFSATAHLRLNHLKEAHGSLLQALKMDKESLLAHQGIISCSLLDTTSNVKLFMDSASKLLISSSGQPLMSDPQVSKMLQPLETKHLYQEMLSLIEQFIRPSYIKNPTEVLLEQRRLWLAFEQMSIDQLFRKQRYTLANAGKPETEIMEQCKVQVWAESKLTTNLLQEMLDWEIEVEKNSLILVERLWTLLLKKGKEDESKIMEIKKLLDRIHRDDHGCAWIRDEISDQLDVPASHTRTGSLAESIKIVNELYTGHNWPTLVNACHRTMEKIKQHPYPQPQRLAHIQRLLAIAQCKTGHPEIVDKTLVDRGDQELLEALANAFETKEAFKEAMSALGQLADTSNKFKPRLAKLLFKCNQLEKAFDLASELDPDMETNRLIADILWQQGKYRQSIEQYHQRYSTLRDPVKMGHWYWRCLKDTRSALHWYQQKVIIDDKEVERITAIAEIHLMLYEFGDVDLDQTLSSLTLQMTSMTEQGRVSNYCRFWKVLGQLLALSRSRGRQVSRCFLNALRPNQNMRTNDLPWMDGAPQPSHPYLQTLLADAYFFEGRLRASSKILNKVIEDSVTSDESITNYSKMALSKVYLRMGKFKAALDQLEALVSADLPLSKELQIEAMVGLIYADLGTAQKSLQEHLSVLVQKTESLVNPSAMLLRMVGDVMRMCYELKPNVIMTALPNPTRFYDQALTLSKDKLEKSLIFASMAEFNTSLAMTLAKQALLSNINTVSLHALARAQIRSGLIQPAKQTLFKVLNVDPVYMEAWYDLAMIAKEDHAKDFAYQAAINTTCQFSVIGRCMSQEHDDIDDQENPEIIGYFTGSRRPTQLIRLLKDPNPINAFNLVGNLLMKGRDERSVSLTENEPTCPAWFKEIYALASLQTHVNSDNEICLEIRRRLVFYSSQ